MLKLLHRGALLTSQHQGLDLLLEVGVEKAIDERVDTGGGHGEQVAHQEDEVAMTNGNGLMVPVFQTVEQSSGSSHYLLCWRADGSGQAEPGLATPSKMI